MIRDQRKADFTAVVCDDTALVRLGITAVLEPLGIDVVGECARGSELPALCDDHAADLVLLGYVTDVPAAEMVQRVRARPAPPIVITLMLRSHREELATLLALDVNALLVRSVQADDLALSVERVIKGERVVAPALLSALVGAVGPAGVEPEPDYELALTRREREVLALLAAGRSNREIAEELFVTLATVKTHIAHTYAKLGARNRNEAIGRAVSLGLLG